MEVIHSRILPTFQIICINPFVDVLDIITLRTLNQIQLKFRA